jgi:hypothetical protein
MMSGGRGEGWLGVKKCFLGTALLSAEGNKELNGSVTSCDKTRIGEGCY